MKYPNPEVAPNISAEVSRINENFKAIAVPLKIVGDAAGSITLTILSKPDISRVLATFKYLSMVVTPLIVVPSIIQKLPIKIINLEAESKLYYYMEQPCPFCPNHCSPVRHILVYDQFHALDK